MWPFKSHPYPRPGFIRYQELLSDLGECARREQDALHAHRADMIGNAVFIASVFAAREYEIRALRELRWTAGADRKQADLDMRRAWVSEDWAGIGAKDDA